MKKMILILSAALVAVTLFTSTPVLAGPSCDTDESQADCLSRLQVVLESLSQTNAGLESELSSLRASQASAASRGDGAEVARLQGDLTRVTAERDEYKFQLDAANRRIIELEGQVTSLETRVTDLETRMTSFLDAEVVRPVAAEDVEEPASNVTADTRLAVYEPRLDPAVFGRTGYRDFEPEIPSPVIHPDVRWRDAGNCLRVENVKDGTDGYVFLRVQGVSVGVDPSGYATNRDILLGPGQSFGFCSDDDSPQMTLTPARVSTASFATREWDGRHWVSVERANRSCRVSERFGADRLYDIGPFTCGW